jgi:hypothetical protein
LIAQSLYGKFGGIARNGRAMYQKSVGLIDCYQIGCLVEYFQWNK